MTDTNQNIINNGGEANAINGYSSKNIIIGKNHMFIIQSYGAKVTEANISVMIKDLTNNNCYNYLRINDLSTYTMKTLIDFITTHAKDSSKEVARIYGELSNSIKSNRSLFIQKITPVDLKRPSSEISNHDNDEIIKKMKIENVDLKKTINDLTFKVTAVDNQHEKTRSAYVESLKEVETGKQTISSMSIELQQYKNELKRLNDIKNDNARLENVNLNSRLNELSLSMQKLSEELETEKSNSNLLESQRTVFANVSKLWISYATDVVANSDETKKEFQTFVEYMTYYIDGVKNLCVALKNSKDGYQSRSNQLTDKIGDILCKSIKTALKSDVQKLIDNDFNPLNTIDVDMIQKSEEAAALYKNNFTAKFYDYCSSIKDGYDVKTKDVLALHEEQQRQQQ